MGVHPRRTGGWAAALLLLSACGTEPEGPGWIRVTHLLDPELVTDLSGAHTVSSSTGTEARVVADETGIRIEASVSREDWSATVREDVWMAPMPVQGVGVSGAEVPSRRMLVAGREVTDVRFAGSNVLIRVEEGEDLPAEAVIACSATPWRVTPEGTLRIAGRRFSGEGLAVWPGPALELEVDLTGPCALRFATCAERAFNADQDEPVTFRVRLDGELVFEATQAVPRDGSVAWHEVALEDAAAGKARLSFEVAGPFAYTSFMAPTVGPLEPVSSPERPDVVVFLADTFRADNLGTYGSTLGLTPNIDTFAAGSLVFARAWSTGASTLPAHASLFAGFFPRQCGIVGHDLRLPEGVVTIAERLARHGYRTGAVTDSVIVSHAFGLDQGFEWFDEHKGDLGSTLERTGKFLDAEDGRPTFLFVQTYRTHGPYEVSAEVRGEHGGTLGIRGARYQTSMDALQSLVPDVKAPDASVAGVPEVLSELRGLYLGGVADLDRGFGAFLADLERRGMTESGYVLFASDHGEGLGDHDRLFHTGKVFEEQVRIPLLISGPEISPGTVDHAASLVDLAPTIARMAGIPGEDRWPGRSLLTLDEDRAMFAFQCRVEPEESTLAVVDGTRKLIGFETPGSEWEAFDLDADPLETRNVSDEHPWPAEMAERYGTMLEAFLVPLFGAEAAALDPEQLEALDAMGYGGT